MSYNVGMTAVAMVRAMINVENGDAGLTADDYSIGAPVVLSGETKNTSLVLTGTGGYDGEVTIKYDRIALADLFALDASAFSKNLTFTAGDLDVAVVLQGINNRFGTVFAAGDIKSITGVTEAEWGDLEGGGEVVLTVEVKAADVAWVGSADITVSKPKADIEDVVTNTELDGLDMNLPE